MGTVSRLDDRAEFSLSGFVALPEWFRVARGIEYRLWERPGEPVTVECGGVTGVAPGALLALARLVESAPNRVRVRNWPAQASWAVLPLIAVTRALDDLVADLSARQRLSEQPAPAELDETVARLAARVAELKRNWLGDEGL